MNNDLRTPNIVPIYFYILMEAVIFVCKVNSTRIETRT